MNPYSIIPWVSLLVSMGTMVLIMLSHKREARVDSITQLETRIAALERELKSAEARIKSLEDHNVALVKENIELLRKIARVGDGI